MEVVIIIPVSRDRYLPKLFASLNALRCDQATTRLLLYIDGKLDLYQKVQLQVAACKLKTTMVFRNKGIGSSGNVRKRRERIADIHNEIKTKLPDCDFVFLIEDDTLVPAHALEKLLSNYDDATGVISGIEIGRHGFPILGAWDKDINSIESVKFDPDWTGLTQVSASGLYCCLVKRQYYVEHTFKPFERILGPDVDFGVTLEEKKLKNYIDNDVWCEHLTPKNSLTFDNTTTMQVKFTRDDSSPLMWRQDVISQTEEGCELC